MLIIFFTVVCFLKLLKQLRPKGLIWKSGQLFSGQFLCVYGPVNVRHNRTQLNWLNLFLRVSQLGPLKKKHKTNWVLQCQQVYQPGLQASMSKTPQGYKTNSWKFRFITSHWVTVKPSESHRESFISKSMLELFEEKRTISEPMLKQLERGTGIWNELLRSFSKSEEWTVAYYMTSTETPLSFLKYN